MGGEAEGDRRDGEEEEMEGGEGEGVQRQEPPTFPNSGRGSILKAALCLHGRTGWG